MRRVLGQLHVTRAEMWLFLFILAVCAPFVQTMTAQPRARYSLTGAVWDHHTVDLSGYSLGIDRATADGELRSDKAPGQPMLVIPVYAAARAVGAEPASVPRVHHNLGLWWVTLWSVVIPLGLLAVLLRRVAILLDAPAPTAAVLVIMFGSTVAAFTTVLFGHILAGTLAFAAWFVLRGADPKRRGQWVLAGFTIALGIATEYSLVLLAAVFTGFVVWRARDRLPWFLLGGVPPVLLLAAYHTVAFGAPWKVGYATKGMQHFDGVGPPSPHILARIFFDQKGLVILAPIIVLALWLAFEQARRPGPARVDAVIALACFGTLLLLQSSWGNPWGGEYPGPRYIVPAMPFLAIPLAIGWNRFPVLCKTLAAFGISAMSLSFVTDGLVPKNGSVLATWVDRVRDHVFTPTIWSMAFGTAGVIVQVGIIVLTAVGLRRSLQRDRESKHPTALRLTA